MKLPSFSVCCLLCFSPVILHAQNGDFTFGNVTAQELYMKRYEKDSTANAVVLKEFGETHINNSQNNVLIHSYHVRIKILNDQGVDKANFIIPIRKSEGGDKEEVYDIKGLTFNAGSEAMRLRLKNVYTENKSRYRDLVKFTLPGVKAGSVIEVQYTLSSPYIRNFRGWDFQSDIPKIYSEYWAVIPANLDYHISLIGFYKLTENDRSVMRNCLTTFNGGKADCTLIQLGMKDVPAFKEEKYMTAKSNFLSAVHFELSRVKGFDGSVKKVAGTWRDVDQELHDSKDFGIQIKKGISFFQKLPDTSFMSNDDDISKAKKIYTFIRDWYKWDQYTGIACETGIKKAFENRQGNIGDINLSLVAALRAAGLDACPVLVSTRDNGVVHPIFPVISEFNYVLVRLETKAHTYLLDASRPALPFGVFPMDCINGIGRIIYQEKPSEWIEITAPVRMEAVRIARLTLDEHGHITGKLTNNYKGYFALSKREEIHSYNSRDEYIEALNSHWSNIKIIDDSISNLDKPEKPLIETMTVALTGNGDPGTDNVVINPFFQSIIRDNPFKSAERHFPVDFGVPRKVFNIVTLKYPPGYHVASSPVTSSLALPHEGGKYILDKSTFTDNLVIKTMLQQDKPVYAAEEYPALKEFYNRIIQSQRSDIILSKN